MTTKESYLKKFDTFVEDVKEDSPHYSENDWKKAEKKFNELSGKDYKKFESDLTPQEKLKVIKLIGQYRGVQIKSGINFLKENINDLLQNTDEFMNGIQQEIK